jgi:hypothetical protein
MRHRTIMLSGLLSVFVTASAAQEPNSRIDLDAVSAAVSSPLLVIARVSFAETDNQCPEDRGMLRIFGGTLAMVRPIPTDPPPTSVLRATTEPADDETQRLSTPLYRAGTFTCQIDIAVRQQVRREGSWESLLVPKWERPSLPPEERRELQRQFRTPMSSRQQQAAFKEVTAWQGADFVGPVFNIDGSTHWSFSFDDRPETCFDFEAVGDFYIERSGLRFSFPTGLPANLNRFVIERTNLDAYRRRLYFTHEDCRFELTISQSVLRGGEWILVPLAMTAPTKK